jgi:hypothetical protein
MFAIVERKAMHVEKTDTYLALHIFALSRKNYQKHGTYRDFGEFSREEV